MGSIMATKEYNPSVMMFPWLAHGHITPFLELAKSLAQYNFHIYFCSAPINLSFIKDAVCSKSFPSIQFVELHLPSTLDLPPHYHNTKSCPPHLMPSLLEAFDNALDTSSDLLISLKPDMIIYDCTRLTIPEVASELNIPAIFFHTVSAAAASYFAHLRKTPMVPFPFPAIYYEQHELKKMIEFSNKNSSSRKDVKNLTLKSSDRSSSIMLIRTSGIVEAKYIEHMSCLYQKEVLPVGVLAQKEPKNDANDVKNVDSFMSWLDKKDKCSTVFVSFGSEYFMSREEMQEVAQGLELSGVNFIWVIRFHEGEETKDLEQVLPQGFMERAGEKGMVVQDWAPQVKILGHDSIGGFVSHCGWNSVLEGLRHEVPLIAMPMQIDQPPNARLMVELGAAVEVKKTDQGDIDRGEMAKVIKEVVVAKGEEELKRRIKDINEKMISGREMDLVVEKLMKLRDTKMD